MSSKKSKPPVDKNAVRARLERAKDEQLVVGVRRWIRGADYIEGFVVGIGARWVAVAGLAGRVRFDGFALLRLNDIQAVTIDPDPDCFTVKALRARSEWPPPSTEVELDDLRGAVTTAAAAAPTTSIFVEFDRPDICYVGSLVFVDSAVLRLLEVDPQGQWRRKARSLDPDDVTRIDFGGDYEEALALVAGPPPRD
ncbi:hypothetical protein GCM10025865_32820 [Paraoerskovia sediminicola]|uniref:PRC-barrel domain-containing protein n=1 Tax=Paraoerskovia sediminicola TaxID=1138587 RepID=A0ABN6X7P1_9CELL|nr:hypothetical protein [Paraoerskovia sediminicola]BDZ40714.1 hypothetical protein GCM10025865_00130 [Paraoerskovia sediminicola]BDZ43983.1 hypothetical protein GCM10025865_32820 [Paraoerskovia sediminicola]